ncbi:c-type cytochrome [Albimonas pacifica]|uniref:Sulfur dehydrogenase subunit SoxD n=1 Tax=Albimonas pacifica TaxID=1114924 RepID=A0A1I3H5S7_9RHOB|nr:c-type cytochrome [Albimonas pacifica]SFI31085.1 sulfur dehydrogenase subunit SoxD [Albimonas pacifica]
MSRFPELTALALAALIATPAAAQMGLGREATPEEVAAWDIDVRPDGLGLPEGSGDVATGEGLYVEKCAVCHGDFGEAVGRWPVLAGGEGTLDRKDPVKTVGSYWPYLSTVWDYVHRAMPFTEGRSLTGDETYAITAYLLYLNDLVDEDFELSRETFLEVEMPNADGFFVDDRDAVEVAEFSKPPCMSACKAETTVTRHATVIDVTPDDDGAETSETEAPVETAAVPAPAAAAPEAPAGPDPELVAAGEKVFAKCKACHQVGEGAQNRTGPILNGTVGAPAAHIDGFKYSRAMTEAAEGGLVWTEETLDAFLEKPKAVIPRTKMSFAGLRKAEDREAIIAYLQSLGD